MNENSSMILLDEPSSALDLESENYLFNNLMDNVKRKNKIGVFISHRIASIKKADQIIVLEDGVIAGIGTHQYLLENCKEYQLLIEEENINE